MAISYITAYLTNRDGQFLQGGPPCAIVLNLPMPPGSASRRSSPTRRTTAAADGPWKIITASSTASCGACTPAPRGGTSPKATAPGKPSTAASAAGVATALG